MAVKAGWDRDTRTCAREGCDRTRAPKVGDEPQSVLCTYHVDAFLARCAAIANAHEPAAPTPTVAFRTPEVDRDLCPRCGDGDAVEHGRSGC